MSERRYQGLSAIYWICIAALVAILLLLPVFPSGDGGAHLYYAHVLGALRAHSEPYSNFYSLRRLFGPYALQYSSLLGLAHLVSMNTAEKLFVVAIAINLALSFRFLSARLGPYSDLASLWAVPILLPWCLVAGFMNYCFAVGVALWGLGFWTLIKGPRAAIAFAAFAACVLVLLISHPVPLMISIVIMGVDLGLLMLGGWSSKETLAAAGFTWRVLALGLACLAFMVPISIADRSRVAGDAHHFGLQTLRLRELLSGRSLSLLKEVPPLTFVFRAFVVLSLPIAAYLTLRNVQRGKGVPTQGVRLAAGALLILAFSLVIPDTMNGSGHFATRLWWPVWLIVLTTVSGAAIGSRLRMALVGSGVAMALLTVVAIQAALAPLARDLAVLDAAPLPHGARGLFLEGMRTSVDSGRVNYSTFSWSGARAFMHSDAILLNSPWMDITISPLKARNNYALINEPSDLRSLNPQVVGTLLEASPRREELMEKVDFIYYIYPLEGWRVATQLKPLLAGRPGWSCDVQALYELCSRHSADRAQIEQP